MSTSIHIPEGLHSFHLSSGSNAQINKSNPVTILLKRVVTDLQKWLNCSWAAGLVPGGSELVPELDVVCVAGNAWRREVPDLICPIRGDTQTGLAAIVAAGPKNDGTPYTDEDHRFAEAMCGHIGGLLENEQMARNISHEIDLAEQSREDVEMARGIYDRLDHGHPRHIPGLEYGGQCRRADQSGGDFFDLLPRGGRSLFVAIGSVAARGLSGGIMLGGALASVRALASRGESVVQIALDLNRTLWELAPEGLFTSFFCAQVDPSLKCLRYVNAGHEPALLVRCHGGHVERLDPTGAVLGLSRRSVYRERFVAFDPGDLFAAFSDGVAESAGSSEVLRILRQGLDCGVQDMAAHVLAAGESGSDRTIVLVRSCDAEDLPLPMEKAALAAA